MWRSSPLNGVSSPRFDDLLHRVEIEHVAGQDEDVRAVVQPALLRKPGVAGAHGADAVETVGENPHPDAGTADQHGGVGFAAATARTAGTPKSG